MRGGRKRKCVSSITSGARRHYVISGGSVEAQHSCRPCGGVIYAPSGIRKRDGSAGYWAPHSRRKSCPRGLLLNSTRVGFTAALRPPLARAFGERAHGRDTRIVPLVSYGRGDERTITVLHKARPLRRSSGGALKRASIVLPFGASRSRLEISAASTRKGMQARSSDGIDGIDRCGLFLRSAVCCRESSGGFLDDPEAAREDALAVRASRDVQDVKVHVLLERRRLSCLR